MPRLPPVLAPLNALVAQFQSAVKHDTLTTSFGSLIDQLDCVVTRFSQVETLRGRKDTDTSDIIAEFGGEATAVGSDTLAEAGIVGTAVDVGLVSYAGGTATYTAVAKDTEGGTTFASTSSYASIYGADLVLVFNETIELAPAVGADVAYSTSSTTFIAIDLEFWGSATGSIAIETSSERIRDSIAVDLEGNAALLEASLEARGAETLVSIDSNVLAIEDTLSSVSARSLLGLGDFGIA